MAALAHGARCESRSPAQTNTSGLPCDFSELNLRAGDRLEPHAGLTDVGQYGRWVLFLATLLFWRASRETARRHRNPVFSPVSGIGTDSVVVVCQACCAQCVWHVWERGWWRVGPDTEDARHKLSGMRLEGFVKAWFRRRCLERPTEGLTRTSDIPPNVLGAKWKPDLALKAGEAKTILFITRDVMGTIAGVFDEASSAAADELVAHSAAIGLAGPVLSGAEHADRLIPRGVRALSTQPNPKPPQTTHRT